MPSWCWNYIGVSSKAYLGASQILQLMSHCDQAGKWDIQKAVHLPCHTQVPEGQSTLNTSSPETFKFFERLGCLESAHSSNVWVLYFKFLVDLSK